MTCLRAVTHDLRADTHDLCVAVCVARPYILYGNERLSRLS